MYKRMDARIALGRYSDIGKVESKGRTSPGRHGDVAKNVATATPGTVGRQQRRLRCRGLQSLSIHRNGRERNRTVILFLSTSQNIKQKKNKKKEKIWARTFISIEAKVVFLSNCMKIYWNNLKIFSMTWECHWHHLMNYWVYVGMIWLNKM